MKKRSKNIVSIVLGILIMITIVMISVPFNNLEGAYNHGRETILENGAKYIAFDSNGQPWVATAIRNQTNYEIEVRTLENNSWLSFTSTQNNLPFDDVEVFMSDHSGNIWVGTSQSGLVMYDGKKWTTFTTQNSGLPADNIRDMEVDSLNRIWICHGKKSSGVTVFDGKKWFTFTTGNSGLLSNEVETIAIDPQGRIWMGALGYLGDPPGVSILDDGEWISYTPDNSGINYGVISDIAFDADGRAYIVTSFVSHEDDGINIFDGKMWEFYSSDDLGISGGGWIRPSIHIDQYQRIWIYSKSTSEFGVRIYDGQNWMDFIREGGRRLGIDDLAEDDQGRIWITSGGELFTIDQGYPIRTLWVMWQVRTFITSGITSGWAWYLVAWLVCLLLAVLIGLPSPLAIALLASISAITALSVLSEEPNMFGNLLAVTPGITASAGGLIGCMIGYWNKTYAKQTGARKYIPLIAGFSIGLAIGFCLIGLMWLGNP